MATSLVENSDANHPQISYEQLVKLAFPEGPFEGQVRYSITWTKPDGSEGVQDFLVEDRPIS